MNNIDIYLKKEDLPDILQKRFDNYLISFQELVSSFEEAVYYINILKEKIENLEQDIQDNYKPINIYDELGINENDFH